MEFISFLVFIVLFCILLVAGVKNQIELFSLRKDVLRLSIEKNIISEKLLYLSLNSSSETPEKSDGFLKFISDSRDWAFEYIENVQDGIQSFISDVDQYIEYWDNYHGAMDTPLDLGMSKISESYKKLKTLLPSDYGKIDT